MNIYFFKANNGNARTIGRICSKLTNEVNNVILVSLLLTLNIFGTLFWCLHSWLWTSEYWMGPFSKFPKLESLKNMEKSHAWPLKRLSPTGKFFKGDHWIVPELKHLLLKQSIRIWYFLWQLLLFDRQLKQVLQIYTNKPFSSSSYSCLPMWICESEVHKHIVQTLDTYCSCFFSEKFESWYVCSHQNL